MPPDHSQADHDGRSAGEPVSLLWPAGRAQRRGAPLSQAAATDLALDWIVRALDATGRHERAIRAILCELCTEPAVIHYRQEILADLLRHPELSSALAGMAPALHALRSPVAPNWPGESPLGTVVTRLRELDHYVLCIDRLRSILESAPGIRSPGLLGLREWLTLLADDPDVVALRAELPALNEMISGATSVTIGLNLDRDLQPESATIIELNRFQFKGPRSLLGRLLPRASEGSATGMTPLQHAGAGPIRRDSQLFKDLQRLLERVTAPLTKALARYREINAAPLAALEPELAFWTGAAALTVRLGAAGVELCRPRVAPSDEHVFVVETMINLALALQMMALSAEHGVAAGGDAARLVANHAEFDEGVRMLVITGPNRGGKTTYCRAIGQAQVLFQAGLLVPGRTARISPVDGIWTHFPLPEIDRPGAGRLDEEVRRLRQIFDGATEQSLILLNEPLTSTSEHDALAIASDLVRALQTLGARVVLVTHLHDLARAIPRLNEQGPADSRIRGLVAQAAQDGDHVRGTYQILPGMPTGNSYAVEVARQHGLTYEQLRQLLVERGAPSSLP